MSYNDLFSKGSLAKKAAFKVAEHLQHRNHKIMKHKVHACKSGAVTKKKKRVSLHREQVRRFFHRRFVTLASVLCADFFLFIFFMKNKAKANQATHEQQTPNSVSERRVTAEWHERAKLSTRSAKPLGFVFSEHQSISGPLHLYESISIFI